MTTSDHPRSIAGLLAAYRDGTLQPRAHLRRVMATVRGDDAHNVWIRVLDDAELEPHMARLDGVDPAALPLYGVPFAIKDNIDLAGVPTTAGCPEYAYVPEQSAFVVQCLLEAGAVPVGKTNLDQFATGLVGTRSPRGACRNAFDPAWVSGGSSSGSAVALALGQVGFALGTDTAGSGRVPAGFNNLIGLKPTRGRLSTAGVVPACRSLDTVSVFAFTAADAETVLQVAGEYDCRDPFARPNQPTPLGRPALSADGFRFGVPGADQLEFFGDDEARGLFRQSVRALQELGGEPVTLDFEPFLEAARLLYAGPWVAERYLAIRQFLAGHTDAVLPVTRGIIEAGAEPSAADAFEAGYRLQSLRRTTAAVWDDLDLICTPTTGTHYRIEQVDADPVARNSDLGYYTNFMNLLDYSAVAVPAGFRASGLPFGVTLFAPAFQDLKLLGLADRLQRVCVRTLGATDAALGGEPECRGADPQLIPVAVCGAHLSGLPLNGQLTQRRGVLLERTRSAPAYRLLALPGGPPERPGMIRVKEGGAAIELEVWGVPADQFGSFVAGIPEPLGIGRVELADGRRVAGFICEGIGREGATDISHLGGWRAYLAG
jgi:allophanate hydrolase